LFEELQHAQIVRIRIEAVSLDSTVVKVHPDGTGALKKTAHKPSASRAEDGLPRFIWLPECSNGDNFRPIAWPGARCARRSRVVVQTRRGQMAYPFADGPRIRRRRNTPISP
jgi:hypothetical protein